MVHEIPATQLKAMLDRGESFVLVDVRSPQERAYAAIPGSYDELLRMDPETTLVFSCHHGERSRAAAHHFAEQGFGNVYNVSDGIEGWSLNVDPTVRRY